MDDFATRLKRTMFIKGVRQVEIAKKAGISKGRISKWMSGQNIPNGENLKKLASVLGVSSDFLLGKEEVLLSAYFTAHKKSRINRPFSAYLYGFCVFLCVGLSCRKIA